MAAGDIVVQMTGMPVVHDEASRTNAGVVHHVTVLNPGTILKPLDWSLNPVTIALDKGQMGALPETFFDSTKQYKLTIEEV
jgi:hypothetical protein